MMLCVGRTRSIPRNDWKAAPRTDISIRLRSRCRRPPGSVPVRSCESREGTRAQFQADSCNWLNRPNVGSPVTNWSTGDFTKTVAAGNRSMHMRVPFSL
jgi:hypothetical protein